MKKKFITFLSTLFLLIFLTTNVSAQWYINSSTNLQTDVLSTYGSFGVYNNVVMNNFLAINVSTTPTCPSSTFSTGPLVDYALVVSGTEVLWDPLDNMRNLIGLSQSSGVSIFSGNDNITGSGIILNAPGTSATDPTGKVQVVSNAHTSTTGTFARAYELLNNTVGAGTGSSSTTNNIFSVDEDGDTRVTGKLSFDFLGGDNAYRTIEGLSPNYGINMYTGSTTVPGSEISMSAPGSTYTGTPGLMQFTSFGDIPTSTLAYDFLIGSLLSAGPGHVFQIDANGHARIGGYAPPTPDWLTIDGDIYINAQDNNDNTFRNIRSRSKNAGLNISSGNNTDGSDGACETQVAWNSGYIPPGLGGLATPGAYIVKAYGDMFTHNASPLAYALQNYSPTSTSLHNIFLINHVGNGIFGYDIALNNIANNDVFTVETSLGFYNPSDATPRLIHGNTDRANLAIFSHSAYNNSSAITLWGNASANPSELQFSSSRPSLSAIPTGTLATFDWYDGSIYHNNLQIGNNGQTVIGPDMNLSLALPADVLTVKDEIGFYGGATMNGNTTNSWLSIHANTGSANGGAIEMYGPSATISTTSGWDADRRGMMRYISDADGLPAKNYAHIFYSWYSSAWHPHMAITNGGKMIIGEDLINAQNYPDNYDLYVENGILTEHLRVALHTDLTNWADYVFAKGYDLMPLNKVADYVKKNKHLPNVPSAEDVQKDGIDVAEMDAKLLQKIEELTLYVIQQQKQIDDLQKKLDVQTK